MTVAVKNKSPVVVPRDALRRAGFKHGQDLEVKVSGGVITILPKLPTADDEYSPAERRVINARLRPALEEVKRGHTTGPFAADEMIASLKRELKTSAPRRAKKAKPRSR